MIRTFLLKLIVSVSLFINFTTMAITIEVADNLEIKEVNDNSFNEGFFSKNKLIHITPEQLKLKSTQTIVVRYKDVFEDFDLGQDRVIETEYFVIKFTPNGSQTYRLKTVLINDISDAEAFVSKPEVMLVSKTGQSIPLELETYADYKLAREVTRVVATLPADSLADSPVTIDDEKIAVAVDNDIADLEVETTSKINDTRSQEFTNNVINKVDTLPMLKYWWQKATTKEKAAFVEFIQKQ